MTHYLRALAARLRGLFGDRRADREIDDEIETHLRLLTERYVRQGMTEAEAVWAARRQFGNVTLLKEEHRDMRGIRLIDTLFQDLRYGARMLLKNPGFTLTAVFTLAFSIGSNTAVFSVVNGVLLKPLPYPKPERLARVFTSTRDFPKFPLSPFNFMDYREHNTVFESFACYLRHDLQLPQEEGAERLFGMRISSGFFRTLGIPPMLGREFTLDEELPYEKTVVVLSYGLWKRRFGGDPNIIGKTIRLSGRTFTVVGVAPAGLQHVGGGYRPLPHGESVDIWWPVWLARNRAWGGHVMNAIGRLKPGVTQAQAEAEFNAMAGQLMKKELPGLDWRIDIQLLRKEITEPPRKALLALLAAVFCVLLIACVNTANLMDPWQRTLLMRYRP